MTLSPAAETVAEREGRERLRILSESLRDRQRRPLRLAADVLLSDDPSADDDQRGVRLDLPRRGFTLKRRKSFKPTGTGSAAIDMFVLQDENGGPPVARLICKTILRTAVEMGNTQWLAEAMFYLDLAPRIACDGVAIPEAHGCRVEGQAVTLVLEFIPPPAPPLAPQPDAEVAARAIGRLGAFTHTRGLHDESWLERVRPRLTPEAFLALEAVAEAALPDAAARDRCLEIFESFMGDSSLQRRLDEGGIACLCHGDLHPKNLLQSPEGDVVFIDWSHAGVGAIGHDLGRLMLPAFLYSPAWERHRDFAAAVDMMAGEVLTGARSLLPAANQEPIRAAIDRALVQQSAMLGVTRRNALEKSLSGGGPQFRERLRSVLDYAVSVATRLIERHG